MSKSGLSLRIKEENNIYLNGSIFEDVRIIVDSTYTEIKSLKVVYKNKIYYNKDYFWQVGFKFLREVVLSKIPKHNRIFVNRSLNFGEVKFVGFDMDHTVAPYRRDA